LSVVLEGGGAPLQLSAAQWVRKTKVAEKADNRPEKEWERGVASIRDFVLRNFLNS